MSADRRDLISGSFACEVSARRYSWVGSKVSRCQSGGKGARGTHRCKDVLRAVLSEYFLQHRLEPLDLSNLGIILYPKGVVESSDGRHQLIGLLLGDGAESALRG